MATKSNYVYNPKSNLDLDRTFEREKKTKTQRKIALEGVVFEDINKILDVGCGTGVVGFDLHNLIPSAELLFGLDIDFSVLQVAKHNNPEKASCSFLSGNIYDLPFNQQAFDLVTCQYVLQHLSQPDLVLAEIRRVTRVGGQVIIFESDDRSGFSYPPAPKELQELFDSKVELIEKKGGDRSIGRKLYHLLSQTGWTDIEVKIIPDIWQGTADRKKSLKSVFLSFTQLKPQLLQENLISERSFEKGLRQLYSYYESEIFSVLFFFAAFARNPG